MGRFGSSEGVVAVDFRHNQRYIGFHTESAGIVDHHGAVTCDIGGIFFGDGSSGRYEGEVDAAEEVGILMREELYLDIASLEIICASGAACRAEKTKTGDGKILLVEHSEEFLTYGA